MTWNDSHSSRAGTVSKVLLPGVASSYTFLYGSLSAVMAVLAWAYLSSLSILWGAQLSYTYSRTRGSHTGDVGPPIPTWCRVDGRVARRGSAG